MKKKLLILLFLIGIANSYASDPAVIYGKWERGAKIKATEVKLYRIVGGRLDEIASSGITNNKSFGFAFEPQGDGFYVIGNGSSTSAQNKYTFYFKPGDRLNIEVNDSAYTLTGENTPENLAISQWYKEVAPLEYKAIYPASRLGYVGGQPSVYTDFFPMLPSYADKSIAFRSDSGSEQFEALFRKFRVFDVLRYAYTFVLTPRKIQPGKNDFTGFYTHTNLAQLTSTTDLLHYPFGLQTIQSIMTVQNMISGGNSVKPDLGKIANDTLKGEFALSMAEKLKTYTDLELFKNEYGKYILTSSQKSRINDLAARLTQNAPGVNTLDFSGTDRSDKKVSVSDFKGKVVVVDVWATWCGPCRKELPSLKALEKEYHDKNVVFLSISLDEAKDKQKWMDFIQREGLTGVQLFGGNGLASDVAKLYNIKGIPRFMVFGKNGKIVTDNAPRPSDPSLKYMIEEQLKK